MNQTNLLIDVLESEIAPALQELSTFVTAFAGQTDISIGNFPKRFILVADLFDSQRLPRWPRVGCFGHGT